MSTVVSYFRLTKPGIISMVVLTGLAALSAEGAIFVRPMEMFLATFAVLLSAGSANAFNQIIERDIDSQMGRTRKRRPLPLKEISLRGAIAFAFVIGLAGNIYLWVAVNPLSSLISTGTLLYYVLFYTAWLKPRHYYNIVIGGAAGSTAPLIAWASATGELSVYAWVMFALIFTWTPPHFWALALAIKEDYELIKYPMLPVVRGEGRTRSEIFIYTLALLPLSVCPYFLGAAGKFGALGSGLLWAYYFWETLRMMKLRTKNSARRLFFVSIFYIFALFVIIALDGVLRHFWP